MAKTDLQSCRQGLCSSCHICVFVQKEAALRSVDMARAENITICTEVQFVACFLCKHSPLSSCNTIAWSIFCFAERSCFAESERPHNRHWAYAAWGTNIQVLLSCWQVVEFQVRKLGGLHVLMQATQHADDLKHIAELEAVAKSFTKQVRVIDKIPVLLVLKHMGIWLSHDDVSIQSSNDR